jgi:hypothetical protein
MPATPVTARVPRLAASRRLAVSSVAPVYASASSYSHSCVTSNANAYWFSRPVNAICSRGDR